MNNNNNNNNNNDVLKIGSYVFNSRLLVGTGKYRSSAEAKSAIMASGAEIVTVALRRMCLEGREPSITNVITTDMVQYLPNSAGCYTAAEAVRTLRLAREIGDFRLVKLEVIGDKTMLYPDVIETIKAAEILANDGFEVMAYTNDDPLIATRLEEAGCVAIMPIGSPIGSGQGVTNHFNVRIIVEQSSVPVILDAGIGTASDAAVAMELGCAGVLLNTALAEAKYPALMAEAMRDAVIAGRKAYLAGRMARRIHALASSPEVNLI